MAAPVAQRLHRPGLLLEGEMPSYAGLGIRVKTGRGIAVVLGGSSEAPRILLRRELSLADREVPDSKQPFHAGLGLSPAEAERRVTRASDAVRRACRRALLSLEEEIVARGLRIRSVGLVRSSDRDPASIRNPHMHAHAAEGHLFYASLADAAASASLSSFQVLEKGLIREVAGRLARSEASLKRTLGALGKAVGPPWRADEKSACAAAWLALSSE